MDQITANRETIQLINGIIEAVVQRKEDIYNPIYFYGNPVSVRIAMNRLEQSYHDGHPKDQIIHTDAVDFCAGIIHAFKDGDRDAYERSFKTARLLLLDSVEVLAGRNTAMDSLYRIVDVLFENGGLVVFGALTTPRNIPSLEERNQAQMEGGIICCVDLKRAGSN